MKKFKKVLIVGLVLLAIAATSITAYAFTGSTPAEIVAGLTGKSNEEVVETKFESGKTYGQIAYDEGLWEEFRDEMLKTKKALLDEKVAEGILSQEEADEILATIETMQENCPKNGGGFKIMQSNSNGNGFRMGNGMGNGFRNGGNKGMGFGGGKGSW